MQKLSDMVNPLISLKEKIRLESDKKVIDDAIELIKWFAGTVKTQRDKIVSTEQDLWEKNTALEQLNELGYTLGEKVTYDPNEIPQKTGPFLGKLNINGNIYYDVVTYDGIKWENKGIELKPNDTLLEYRKLPNV